MASKVWIFRPQIKSRVCGIQEKGNGKIHQGSAGRGSDDQFSDIADRA